MGNGRESLRSDRGIARKNSSFLLSSQLSRRPETLAKRAVGTLTSAWRLFRPRLHLACEQALSLSRVPLTITSHYKPRPNGAAFSQAISIRQKEIVEGFPD